MDPRPKAAGDDVLRLALQLLLLLLCSSAHASYDIGANYHLTNADFENGAFISRYNVPSVRAAVQAQLQVMADSGATMVKTMLWQVGDNSSSWRLSFPFSAQELTNIATYAQDVGQTRRPNGQYLRLSMSMGWLGCADYTTGSPNSTVGICGISWNTFTTRAQASISSLTQKLKTVVRPDGQPAVSTLYLDLEVMIGAKANQDRFLQDFYPYFLDQTTAAGINGSIYFLVVQEEANILDDNYQDAQFAALNRHKSLFWVYRSVDFMATHGLVVPHRLDFSFYPDPVSASYSQLVNRVFDDITAVFPGHSAAVVETYYLTDATKRRALGQAFAASYLSRGMPEQTIFWTTPNGGGPGVHVGPPFDFSAFALPSSGSTACDINSDGLTNVADVQLTANQAVGFSSCTADLNHDNSCNVIDVQFVVNAVLNGTCVTP